MGTSEVYSVEVAEISITSGVGGGGTEEEHPFLVGDLGLCVCLDAETRVLGNLDLTGL